MLLVLRLFDDCFNENVITTANSYDYVVLLLTKTKLAIARG